MRDRNKLKQYNLKESKKFNLHTYFSAKASGRGLLDIFLSVLDKLVLIFGMAYLRRR